MKLPAGRASLLFDLDTRGFCEPGGQVEPEAFNRIVLGFLEKLEWPA